MLVEQYTKPPLSHKEQFQRLKDRGLLVEDDSKALHLLRHISCYRLSGYWHPLLQQPKHLHLFKLHASFKGLKCRFASWWFLVILFLP